MILVLAVIFAFVILGLVSTRIDGRQNSFIAVIATLLAAIQFALPRYL
ncbi:MAG: hypothetical protein ACRDF9_14555 [Candidatus Limnocylindria bacterium]